MLRTFFEPTCATRLGAVLLAGFVGFAPACTSAPAPAKAAPVDRAAGAPSDLSLEIVVTPGRGVEERAKIEERPARFVLLADGSLMGEADRLPSGVVRPARVRRLSREQMTDVWSVLVAAGFSDAKFVDTHGNVRLLKPQAGEVLATLELYANGERLCFARHYKPGDESELAMRRVVRSLASLAWASDEALADSAELPVRYDLGADPYARFAPRAAAVPAAAPAPAPVPTPATEPAPATTPAPVQGGMP